MLESSFFMISVENFIILSRSYCKKSNRTEEFSIKSNDITIIMSSFLCIFLKFLTWTLFAWVDQGLWPLLSDLVVDFWGILMKSIDEDEISKLSKTVEVGGKPLILRQFSNHPAPPLPIPEEIQIQKIFTSHDVFSSLMRIF